MRKFILQILREKYNKITLTKQEVADELGLSLRTIDKLISEGNILPEPIKIGPKKNSSIRFNIADVANYIDTTMGEQ